ncbi:glycosyl hydrolase family 43 [Altericroceibacterium spongiae]|uniref:Glycosyl hydrolase family 43 n=1 Tax=Altericroceibacterium spongiae TaxID=2320269 RepID=A0A420EDZ8_9SPHN|nr:family 43 glycosylhydrolase [Altericroceibacterium spongiae]RKF18917.1 glycosyl hydrolase family 43 [Altericroceibacterium spongiae]
MTRFLTGSAAALMLSAATIACAGQSDDGGRKVHAPGNPILADGEYYSTDPAPFVFDGKLWILAGRDEAPEGVNDFIMPEWQLLETSDPASGEWVHYPAIARPHDVFDWAEKGRAYAGQIVKGLDGRLYFYAPVMEKDSDAKDRFAIGVAVADSPTGPWHDAHPSGPIISQRVPVANTIQNIDPTVLVDDDGRVYLYWGTFGQLRGVELEPDMMTPKGDIVTVDSLTGFFEAPWLMKRKGTYYMLYAGNKAGPDSECTPAVYHACIAYGTAPSPLGPWTYRGVVLKPVSSTTSHPGVAEFKGHYYFAYHTADAKGGGPFRRSVAVDEMTFDDSRTPAAINLVTPTKRPGPAPEPTRNIAPEAQAFASNQPIPVQYWIKALNDRKARKAPLPPEMWGNWSGDNPASEWIEYRWEKPVTVNGSRIWFFADQPAGSGIGVAPPAQWQLFYWDGSDWAEILTPDAYPGGSGTFLDVSFPPVKTRCLRAVLTASGDGKSHAGMGVEEWEVLTPEAKKPGTAPVTPMAPCE